MPARSAAPCSRTAGRAFHARFSTRMRWRSGLVGDHRDDVVAERTRMQNRLRWHLVELCPELERALPARALERQRHLDRIARALRRLPACARVRVAQRLITRIRQLTREANALEAELRTMVERYRPELLAEVGCGALIAS